MSSQAQVLHAVLGTAGHIDHGKSTLVKVLTGTDPDRFKEERERGMTIDIGFAEYRTPEGVDVGLIDVPGHERFIRNMVAGASGMDMVMLVVAADDSVMPQTREHLEIMTLLGLTRGFTVITKTDAVEGELVDLVAEEVREFLSGTFLEGAPVLRASALTGDGVPEVRSMIDKLARELPPRDQEGVFRMPVQRSFTIKGHGTVVTGVPLAGTIRVGDPLEVLPARKSCRVRGVQVHHRPAQEGGAGHRTAINLSDISYREVHRGDVVSSPGYFEPTRLLEARFQLLPSWTGALRDGTPVRVHVGCAEVMGRLALLDTKALEPGQDALIQLRLEDPVVAAPGDHYLLRLASPERTLGGGLVLGQTRYRFKRFRDWINENLKGKEASLNDRLRYLEYVIRSEGLHPVPVDKLPLMVKDAPAAVRTQLRELLDQGRVQELQGGKEVLHADMVARGAGELEKALHALHEADHYPFGFSLQAIASRMKHPVPAVRLFLQRALEKGTVVEQAGQHRLRAFKGSISNEDRRLLGAIEEAVREGGFQAPNLGELSESLKRPKKRIENVLTLLENWGRVVKLADNVYLHATHVKDARDKVVDWCREHGELPSNTMKDVLGATRKYVIPLLEHFDRLGLTERHDSVRVLKKGWEQVLPDGEGATGQVGESGREA